MLLSVVATSRNDDHGGNALWRTQHFVDGLAHQAKKHQVSIELLLVDWNPLPDRVGLYDALTWPETNDYFQYRVIVVPNSYHQQFKHSDDLPLFQYLAKNVGIRRASGDFILATNIDILFSDQLFQFFKHGLKKGYLYRVDRFDMDDKIPEGVPFEDVLSYAEKNILRVNAAMSILSWDEYKVLYADAPNLKSYVMRWKMILGPFCGILYRKIFKAPLSFIWGKLSPKETNETPFHTSFLSAYPNVRHYPGNRLSIKLFNLYLMFKSKVMSSGQKGMHTHACGDFTLLSRDDWYKLKAYPEWDIYSWEIDSILLYQAYYSGIKMQGLTPEKRIFHIEHGKGSGFTKEHAALLFKRIEDKKIIYINNDDLEKILFDQYQLFKNKKSISYNSDDWGAADVIFAENNPIVQDGQASA